MTDFRQILKIKFPNDEWSIGDDYASLLWQSTNPKPSEQELLEAEKEIAAEDAKRVAARDSAGAKLAKLGLTKAEVAALLGA